MLTPERYALARRELWDTIGSSDTRTGSLGGYYRGWLTRVYRFLIPPGLRVLELGCAEGDLLAAVQPSEGVGVDFSGAMLERARARHPALTFIEGDAHDIDLAGRKFDCVILSDLFNDVRDVQQILEHLHGVIHPGTRVISNSISHSWELPVRLARRAGIATRQLSQNWLTVDDIKGLMRLADLEPVKISEEIIWPLKTPVIADFMNRYVARLWPFSLLAFCHFIVARPRRAPRMENPRVSVVVAARNEAGNVDAILERVPELGAGTELIFVEGGSTDDTYDVLQKAVAEASRPCKLLQQDGTGKGDAVRKGFENATGDVLMILDADLTVAPEALPRFVEALVSGKGEFINGVRLVYPMDENAMRFFNLVGNKFFGLAFSWLLGQPIKDTLCGTKVLWREDYEDIAASRAYFGTFDPFGDFDLLFGAAKQNRKIIDLPVRYHARVYGETNIDRWAHGWLLIRMVAFAARKLKFV